MPLAQTVEHLTFNQAVEGSNPSYSKWEDLSGDEKDYPHRKFTRTTKSGKESPDTFFCNNLCGFKDCPHIRKYLDTRENNTEEDDLF